MGKLNILHHKEWHVYSHDNRNKVIKDEKVAKKKADFVDSKRIEIEAERRLLKLKEKQPQSKKIEKHINFFEDAEKYQHSELIESDAAKAQRKKEERFTVYLGETHNGKKSQPWYSKTSTVVKYQSEKSKFALDAHRKSLDDPMSSFQNRSNITNVTKKVDPENLSIDEMRMARLKREKAERDKFNLTLNPPKQVHETKHHFYHSQYNREHIRRKH